MCNVRQDGKASGVGMYHRPAGANSREFHTGRVVARGRVARGVTTLPQERNLRGGPIAPRRRKKLGRAGSGPGSIPEGSRGRVNILVGLNNIITYIIR